MQKVLCAQIISYNIYDLKIYSYLKKCAHTEDLINTLNYLDGNNSMPLFVTDGHGMDRVPKTDAGDITNASIAEINPYRY